MSPGNHRKAQQRMRNIYVVRLSDDVAVHPRIQKANPNKRADKPWVYVGMSVHDPVHRFKQHKDGHKASKYVKRYGLELMPRHYARYNPLTYEEASTMEVEIARRLRKRGFGVWQR